MAKLRVGERSEDKSMPFNRKLSTENATICPPPSPCVCSSNGSGNNTSSIILKFLVPELGYANFKTMLTQVAEKYQRLSENNYEIQFVGLSDMNTLMTEVLFDVDSKAGQFDGYIIDPVRLGEIASKDGFYDMTETTRNYKRNPNQWLDILPFYREILSTYDGRVVLTPFDGDVFSMFFREDLFDAHSIPVPKTWDEYISAAKYFHGLQVEVMDPLTNETSTKTMAGSCYGRVPACGGAYWAQNILASMTQADGSATGSLLDSKNLNPLLGEAMEETLRILEEQAEYGSFDEFDGCTSINFQAMNEGRCALTISWGNSFTEHTAKGSVVVGKLGVAATPGSQRILDRNTNRLVDCTPEICPNSVKHVDAEGNEIFINQAPYAAYGGFSAGISNNVNQEHKDVAADFILFASDTGQSLQYVVPDREKEVVPTGQDPWRYSLLNKDVWVSRGYPEHTTIEYLNTIRQQTSSKNVVTDLRIPKASDIFEVLDEETYLYLNNTVRYNKIRKADRPAERAAIAQRIGNAWAKIIKDYDNDPSTTIPLLETYQRSRGVYKAMNESASLSTITIVVIVVVSGVVVLLIAAFGARWTVYRDRKKRDEENWYIPYEQIEDTGVILGRGSFGLVTKGFYRGSAVALKHPHNKYYDPEFSTVDGDWNFDTTLDTSVFTASQEKKKKNKNATHDLQNELMALVKLRNPNIVETLGATFIDNKMIIVLQYMKLNTVRSILKDANGVAGTAIFSLETQWALQVASGLAFLHAQPPPKGPMLHNDLKSSNVLVDEAFNAHISDFGLATKTINGVWGWYQSNTKRQKLRGSLLWMAPEVLHGSVATPASDVYSYAMFLCELMTRKRPYDCRVLSAEQNESIITNLNESIVKEKEIDHNQNEEAGKEGTLPDDAYHDGRGRRRRVSFAKSASTDISPPQDVGGSGADRREQVSFLETETLATDKSDPSLEKSTLSILKSRESLATGTMDAMVGTVQGVNYTRDEIIENVKDLTIDPPFRPDLPEDAPHFLKDICIEAWHKNPKRRPTMKEIEERLEAAVSNVSLTRQLINRGSMFDSIIPRDVQDKLARGEHVPPVPYTEASVIFSDIVSFTTLSAALSAEQVGSLILRMLSEFDKLCKKHNVKKLDVIGDAFIGVVGVPKKVPDHANKAAMFALEAIKATSKLLVCEDKPDLGFIKIRFGISSGPVVATVIGGAEHPKYTLYGDTVNVASRMESSGEANRCQCTEATMQLLVKTTGEIKVEERGLVEVKGKGKMTTYWLSLCESSNGTESVKIDDIPKYVEH